MTVETLGVRRDEVAASADLRALADRLARNVQPLIERPLYIPEEKALLSRDGGVCPDDGERLVFDPWQPEEHRCPRCGRVVRGERHHRAWAMWYQLWLAERAVHLALLAGVEGRGDAAARACDILVAYGDRYPHYPNRDNVLGPGRVFGSTYLESIWLLNLLTAATILREVEALTTAAESGVHTVAEESVAFIGEFNEYFSNRQVWHDAALLAAADWFQDEALGLRALEGETGILALIHVGLARDGMWYEGENYHFFALRGLLHAIGWGRRLDYDLMMPERGGDRVRAAFRTPLLTALPDLTFPARKDSAFGVSLIQPRFAELWEVGHALTGDPEVLAFLHRLYHADAPPPEGAGDGAAWVADVERNAPAARLRRSDLSWMSLLWMRPELPPPELPWKPASVALERHGLAILRTDDRYVSLECGRASGGHDHPDRLHLTLHAGGKPWLLDFGTGSYFTEDLFWYRSTRAHNAPMVDGRSQRIADAHCVAHESQGAWGWVRGRLEGGTAYPGVAITRTVVVGPDYLLDVVEARANREVTLEVPWHFLGRLSPLWLPGTEVLQETGLGPPGAGQAPFAVARARGTAPRLVAVLDLAGGGGVRGVVERDGMLVVQGPDDRHVMTDRGWRIENRAGVVELAGVRPGTPEVEAIADLSFLARPEPMRGLALAIERPPAVDGTLSGFLVGEPLRLETEDQYRRAEAPYPPPGAERFAATAHVNWDAKALYVAVQVRKPDPTFRPADAPPLQLDNEADDIHSDGVQVYLDPGSGDDDEHLAALGFLVVPDLRSGGVRVRPVAGTAAGEGMVRGAWRARPDGYCVTLALTPPGWGDLASGGTRIGFDLLVNEMYPDRQRRAGQLVWSGRNGWVWLQGDRQHPSRFGELELCP